MVKNRVFVEWGCFAFGSKTASQKLLQKFQEKIMEAWLKVGTVSRVQDCRTVIHAKGVTRISCWTGLGVGEYHILHCKWGK